MFDIEIEKCSNKKKKKQTFDNKDMDMDVLSWWKIYFWKFSISIFGTKRDVQNSKIVYYFVVRVKRRQQIEEQIL